MKEYKKGDRIKYGSYGECEILDMREENLGGKTRDFYILRQNGSTSTIYVPVEKVGAFKEIKDALTLEQIKAVINANGDCVDWSADDKTRDANFRQAYEREDLQEISGILKNILAKQQELKENRKKLRATDANAIKVCEKILYDELSKTLNIEPEDVTPLITGVLEPSLK